MPTAAAQQALQNLRDPGLFQWYVIPLLTIAAYIYFSEIERRNWNAVFAGLTYLCLDCLAEVGNSLVFHFNSFAPAWGTPGSTAYLILIGMNAEIFFMFSLVGLCFSKLLPEDRKLKIAGIPNRILVAICAAAVCVFVEVMLNRIGALTWETPWWRAGAPTIFLYGGYFIFFTISFAVYDLPRLKQKITAVGALAALNAACFILFMVVLKWI